MSGEQANEGCFCEEELHGEILKVEEDEIPKERATEEEDEELIENERKYFAAMEIVRENKDAEKARNEDSPRQTNLRESEPQPSSSSQDNLQESSDASTLAYNLQACVSSPSGAIGTSTKSRYSFQASAASPFGATETSTESRENSKKFLQDSAQLSEKEEFQNILRDAERQLAEGDGDSAIGRVEEFLSKESRSAMDVKNMSDDLEGKDHYVQAMILYKISHDLHKKEGRFSPDDELYWIEGLTSDIHWIIDPLIKAGRISRKIATKIAVEFLTQFLEEIREVKNANPEWKARVESHCLSRIVHTHRLAGEVEECVRFGEEALSIMAQQLGQSAFCYHLSGILFQNLGDAYHDLGRYADAERCLIAAIEIYKKALDYERGEREHDITLAKQILEKTRKKLAE